MAPTPTPEVWDKPYPREVWEAFQRDLEEAAQAYMKDTTQKIATTLGIERGSGAKRNDLIRLPLRETKDSGITTRATGTSHRGGAVLVMLPQDLSQDVLQLAHDVDGDDLAKEGRETDPHVTIVSGFHESSQPEALRAACAKASPVTIELGPTAVFPGSDTPSGADVLMLPVDSDDLRALHESIVLALSFTEGRPTYRPHVTIAWLKPGRGKDYAGNRALAGRTVTISSVAFSTGDALVETIPLGKRAGGKTYPFPVEAKYSDDQPRDEHGRWSGGGGAGGGDAISQAYFTGNATVAREEGADARQRELFGRTLTDGELQGLAAAPDGATVTAFATNDGALRLMIDHDLYRGTSSRAIYEQGGHLVIENVAVALADDAPAGLGTHMLASQVATADRLGIREITTMGSRSDNENGYYTWPRLGYDGPLPRDAQSRASTDLGMSYRPTMISDVMRQPSAGPREPSGAQWWKQNGDSIALRFDTRDGSLSRDILDGYMAEKGYSMAKSVGAATSEEVVLTAEDEAILDRVWARVTAARS